MIEFQEVINLYGAGLPVFPCHPDKKPAVRKDESWQDVAQRDPNVNTWPSRVVGVPVPPGVVIIDLDIYKGVTRQAVEQSVGAALDWDRALLQITQNGGEHYAFAAPSDWEPRQGSNINKVQGFDTRTAGRGYIATGQGYEVRHPFGLYALLSPAALPALPAETRPFLEREEHDAPDVALPDGDRDIDTIKEALSHLNPHCGRDDWRDIGLALRHHFHDEPEQGLVLFDQWSRGALTGGEIPPNYVPDTMEHQWYSFKPENGSRTIRIGTLFKRAILEGWKPPATIDTSEAFGQSARPDLFNELVDRITEQGGDPKQTNDLITAVKALRCNELQRGMLLATLHRELRDANLLTKDVRQQLENKTPTKAPNEYGNNHTENATIFVDNHYSDATLVRYRQTWYSFDGKSWVQREDEEIKHEVALALAPGMPQHAVVSGTYSMLESLATVSKKRIGDVPRELVIMQNGVLNLNTGGLLAHDMRLFTTNILPYNYNINARCPRWEDFLNQVFEGDQERIDLLQEWFGYMMTNSYEFQKIMLLLGAGRSGKGTVGRMLKCLVGEDNYSGGTLTSFAKDPFIASLSEKTVVFIGDAPKSISRYLIDTVTERIKGISGCDDQSFDRKHKSLLSQAIPARITLSANNIPGLFDDSGALASRMLVLPFSTTFLGREDPHLFEKLQAEIEGVAMWALVGLARLRENGRFTVPSASDAETQFIKEAYSPLRTFVEACCIIGGDGAATSEEIYEVYRNWAVAHQEDHVKSRRHFIGDFKDLTRGTPCKYGTHRTPQGVIRGFSGITLRPVDNIAGSIPLTAVK